MLEDILLAPKPEPRSDGELIPVLSREDANIAARQLAEHAVAKFRNHYTRKIYQRRIEQFLASGHSLSRLGVRVWISEVRTQGEETPGWKGDEVISQSLAGVKALARECAAEGLITQVQADGILALHNPRQRAGNRMGNWLTQEQAVRLYRLPDRAVTKGQRDAALFALLLGCGLRREEAIKLVWSDYTEREGRMVLCDLLGKGNKIRTLGVPEYARLDLDVWREAQTAKQRGGARDSIVVSVTKGGGIGSSLTGHSVWLIVREYGALIGVPTLAPHDLRRTLAHLMDDAGAGIVNVAAVLGHVSVETTQRYLGSGVELRRGLAATDKVEL